MGAGAGAVYGGGESAGRVLLSSSHVEVMSSSKRRFGGREVGAGGALRGNSIVKYCCMTGRFEKCILLGYLDEQKGYNCYNPEPKRFESVAMLCSTNHLFGINL